MADVVVLGLGYDLCSGLFAGGLWFGFRDLVFGNHGFPAVANVLSYYGFSPLILCSLFGLFYPFNQLWVCLFWMPCSMYEFGVHVVAYSDSSSDLDG